MVVQKKSIFVVSGAITLLLVLAVTILVLFIDVDAYKPLAEAAASDALGMDVRVDGKMRIVFSPGFSVSLRDVHIKNGGTELLSVEYVRIGIELIPLIRREVRITTFGLIRPDAFLERDRKGTFNFEKPQQKPSGQTPRALLSVEKLFVSGGKIRCSDQRSGESIEVNGLDVTVTDLSFARGSGSALIKNLSFTAAVDVKDVKTKKLTVSNLKVRIHAKGGTYDMRPITMTVFNGAGQGSIAADMRGKEPAFTINYTVSKLRVEEFVHAFSEKKVVDGEMDFSLALSMAGKSFDEIKRTSNGEVSLRGEDLTLRQLDLDALFTKYEKSQSFNLVDVGAYLLAGPFGPALTKGYNFASVYEESRGGRGVITKLVSDWKVQDGVAEAKDVAFATKENRIALKGGLDLINDRFNGVTVALLDEKGCVRMSQGVHGSFRHPRIDTVNAVQSLLGPVLNIFEKTKKLVNGGQCEVFYSGSVQQPK